MKTTSSLNFVAATLILGASHVTAIPSSRVEARADTSTFVSCYKSSDGLSFGSSLTYNSKQACNTQCKTTNSLVQATTNKKDCWCGDSLPSASDKVASSYCNDPCAGFNSEMCGSAGSTYFSVYTTGVDDSSVDMSGSSSSSSSASSSTPSPTTSSGPSVVTTPGETVVVTASNTPHPSTSATGSSSSGGSSKAGIAAGVVVGVVALAAIAGGIYLFVRNKRRREVEEEYKRNALNSSLGGKPPTSSAGASSFNDTRLDPVMAQRRMSDGSIMDNQDYSRRILKVTNA